MRGKTLMTPAFGCDNAEVGGGGTDFGDWFGMKSVHFHENMASHGTGDVLYNIVCTSILSTTDLIFIVDSIIL